MTASDLAASERAVLASAIRKQRCAPLPATMTRLLIS